MIDRCENSKSKNYKYYGARGITICERWRVSFKNFIEDMGERPYAKTLDRIDNNGNYEPSNCRWASLVEQRRNTRLDKRNLSGVKGVYWNKWQNKWGSYISVNKAQVSLGLFTDKEDAIKARKEAEIKYW